MNKRWSILLGRVFGIPIRVHFLLILLFPVLPLLYSNNFLSGLIIAFGLFTSVALHELGHSVVAMRKGCHVQEIMLSPIGGTAKMSHIPTRPMDEFLIAAAGPLVSLVLGLVGILSGVPVPRLLGVINLLLFSFNILPCFPMDGGRMLRAFLSLRKGRMEATRIAVQVSKYFCGLFLVFGIIRLQFLLVFLAFYVWKAGQMEYRMMMLEYQANRFNGYRNELAGVKVSPPSYAVSGGNPDSFLGRMKKWFSG